MIIECNTKDWKHDAENSASQSQEYILNILKYIKRTTWNCNDISQFYSFYSIVSIRDLNTALVPSSSNAALLQSLEKN